MLRSTKKDGLNSQTARPYVPLDCPDQARLVQPRA